MITNVEILQNLTAVCFQSYNCNKKVCVWLIENISKGDSGGPMICNRGKLTGIVSRGPKVCGQNSEIAGIYTNIGFYRKWINSKIKKRKIKQRKSRRSIKQ